MKLKKKSNKWNITKEFITTEYIKKKRSLPEIAKEIGIPYETLFWYKKKFDIPTHNTSIWNKGKRLSPSTEFKKGQKPWNTGTKGVMKAWNKGKEFDAKFKKKISIATKKAMAKPDIIRKVKKTQFKRGTTPWNKGKRGIYSKDTITKIKSARLKQIFPKKATNIELILFRLLDELNIKFDKHKAINQICQADAFIEPNILLFADGDHWHCNPKFYDEPKTKAQIKNLARDTKTNSKLIKEGYLVRRFWEHDLINNTSECKVIIQKLIKGDSNG